ncbi:MAG TPA: PHP domain-containing protein [bacterium]|nr:PHP domain-containing protein [bacterium]
MEKLIDLHAHTTASDGSLTPTQLVQLARDSGLGAVAITDHDTIDGVAEGLAAGAEMNFEVVPGVELSTDLRGKTVHVLGYFIAGDNDHLAEKLAWAKQVRAERNDRIIERFNELGIEMTLDEVRAEAGGDVVGRPHFARVLLKKGAVATVQEAFDIYLDRKGKAYVPKFRFTPEESVSLILQAGGLPVLAHPGLYKWSPLELDEAVGDLVALGLVGLEVLYSTHLPAQVLIYNDIARRHHLLPTGGSDYHGQTKPDIQLGSGMGDLHVPYAWLAALKAKADRE